MKGNVIVAEEIGFKFYPTFDVISGRIVCLDVYPDDEWIWVEEDEALHWRILESAFSRARFWLDQVAPCDRLAFALAPCLTLQPNLPEWLVNLADSRQLETSQIKLHLGATDVISRIASDQLVSELYEGGFQVSVASFISDDSQFSILSHPHIQTIVCDSHALDGLAQCGIKRRLMSGLADLCKLLGKDLIVRGVADERNLKLMSGLGVRYFQGRCVGSNWRMAGL